ncbi:MAG: phosphoribosylglycinamide formyltransferase [Abditibacteriota bacterium]|nr:phosphoribosylglycinamide formyltransferase [Abditibacteriota bacterium]
MKPVNIAVMISGHGRGSNMTAIIEGCESGKINGKVVCVIGVNETAPAVAIAREHGIETVCVPPKTTENYDDVIFDTLKSRNVDLVCLAGYMRLLGAKIVKEYKNRIMNVHPALIPLFCGKGMYGIHVHTAAIEYGVKVSGATVHFVNEEYDLGPIIAQKTVPVLDDDTPETLAARVLEKEHECYVESVALFSQGKLKVEGRKVIRL